MKPNTLYGRDEDKLGALRRGRLLCWRGRGSSPAAADRRLASAAAVASLRSEERGEVIGMRRHKVIAGTVAVALGATGVASGQAVSGRQDADIPFRQERPDRGTAMRVEIDYQNPGNPDGKPFAVRRVVLALENGSHIDTSVPARCRATDAQLTAQGRGACSPESVVGDGRISLDTGSPGQRIIRNRAFLLNNRDELIFLLRSTNTPQPSRVVSRAEVRERKVITVVPPVPGQPPPDPFTAIKRVRLGVERITEGHDGGSRSYIETPGSCPAGGEWVNRARFTYRDDVTQREATRSPCEA